MSFVQILEFDTRHPDEIEALMNEWHSRTETTSAVQREVVAQHHSRPGHYVAIIEFLSYEDAQRNSKLPETEKFNVQMSRLCDGTIKFSDYDVIRDRS